MPRLTDLLITLILLFAALPQPAKAFDLGGAIDSFFDDLSDAAEDAQEILCATREINPYLCLAATVADDVIGEIADPTPCGAPGQGTCIALIDPKRFKEIGGPCERGLIEIPNVICVAPVSTEEAVWTAEDIAWLALALVEAYQSFKVQDPRKLIDLLSAIEDPDAERVEQIVRDSQYFDEAFAIMSRLGMDTATMSVSGGGFVLLGGGAEGGVALDTGIEALPQVYRTQVSSFGIQAGAGIDLLIGGWVPSNCDIGGKAIGAVSRSMLGQVSGARSGLTTRAPLLGRLWGSV